MVDDLEVGTNEKGETLSNDLFAPRHLARTQGLAEVLGSC